MQGKLVDNNYILYNDEKEVGNINLVRGKNPFYILMTMELEDAYDSKEMEDKLLNSFYDYLKSEDEKVEVICSIARKWFIENPEKQDVIYK